MSTAFPFTSACLLLVLGAGSAHAQRGLRAWHADGQTFLIWQHTADSSPTYEIYASRRPFSSLAEATWIGRVFGDNAANHRLFRYVPGARWILPGPGSGTTRVANNESYFVSTPRTAGSRYFAVIATGSTVIPNGMAIGPVPETVGAVTCHLQFRDREVSIFAHWIDGHANHAGGRSSYPVMGNEFANGLGFNFAVWEPRRPRRVVPTGLPLLCGLHGRGGDLFDYAPVAPGTIGRTASFTFEGLAASFDDGLRIQLDSRLRAYIPTYFFGYDKKLNRFRPEKPSRGATIPDYTSRRILWEIDWIRRNFPVDPDRIALMGVSMGGAGALYLSQSYPERFSACLVHVPAFDLTKIPTGELATIFGTPSQKPVATVPGAPEVYNLLDQAWRLRQPRPHWPFTRIVCGRNDSFLGWSHVPAIFRELNRQATGFTVYWDERGHTLWTGSHFLLATRSVGAPLTAYSSARSFPAFHDVDLDPNKTGLQPDPGDGSAASGTPWGTWGGYLTWNPLSVLDRPDFWEAQISILTSRIHSSEKAPVDKILAAVSPHRRKRFVPPTGSKLGYQYRLQKTEAVVNSGTVEVARDGEIRIPQIEITRAPATLRIFPVTRSGRGPVYVELGQHDGPGSVRLVNRGLRPGAFYVNLITTNPTPDGQGTGWAYGVSLLPGELSLLSMGYPFIGVADRQGRGEFRLPRGSVPPITLEVFSFEFEPYGLGANSGPFLVTLR